MSDNIPEEIQNAAALLDNYFTQRGIVKWELGNVCSRNHADNVKVYENYFEFIKDKNDSFSAKNSH